MKRIFVVFLIGFSLIVFFDSCKKKSVKTEPVTEGTDIEKVGEETPQISRPVLTDEELFQKRSLEEVNKAGYLKKINFDFDKYFIKDNMKPVLNRNADWLLKHSGVQILIEGHCDERGTFEYNMALGEKRAEAASKYLVSLGVSSDRIRIISYGKSRPLVKGIDEQTYYENRRDEFTIIKK